MKFGAYWLFCPYYRIFGLSKGPTYIRLEKIRKVFIILFLLCHWR